MSYLSPPDRSLEEEPDVRWRLVCFYEKHNPLQLNHIDTILFAYRGHWEDLFAALTEKYGQDPRQSVVAPSSPFVTNDRSILDVQHHESGESVGSDTTSFSLLDPITVIRQRREKVDGDTQQRRTRCVRQEGEGDINFRGAQCSFRRPFLSTEEQRAVVRRLRLQRMFLLFAPNEVLRMEDVMAQYREAYSVDVHAREGCRRDITDEEWQEAMISDFLHDFEKEKNQQAAGGSCNTANIGRRRIMVSSQQRQSSFSLSEPLEVADSPYERQCSENADLITSHIKTMQSKKTMSSLFSSLSLHSATHSHLQTRDAFLHGDNIKNEIHNVMHSHAMPIEDKCWAPPKDDCVADVVEDLLTPTVEKLYLPSIVSFSACAEDNLVEKNEITKEKAKNAEEKVVLSRNSFLCGTESGDAVFSAFLQTHEELQVESFLTHHVIHDVLECPLFHYRLFLLLCCFLEYVRDRNLSLVSSTSTDVLTKREMTIPNWEPSLQSCVFWSAIPARKGPAFLISDEKFAAAAPRELLEKIHASWSLVQTVGLESLWCDKVTLADVVAVRMRYFTRRKAEIKRVVLCVFSHLSDAHAYGLDSGCSVPNCSRVETSEPLCFIDAVKDISNTFLKYSEREWSEFIQAWEAKKGLGTEINAMQNPKCSFSMLWEKLVNAPLFHDLIKSSNDSVLGETEEGVKGMLKPKECNRMLFVSPVQIHVATLLSCTVLLCLHVDQQFTGITYVDVVATHHCLNVAVIMDGEEYDRCAILLASQEEFTILQRHAGESSKKFFLQEQERRQRDAIEVQQYTSWLRAMQFVLRANEKTSNFVAPTQVPSSRLLYLLSSHQVESLLPTNQNALMTSMSSPTSQRISQWRREAVQRRVAAFFEREARRQRRLADRRQVEQVVKMLRAGKLSL